MSTEKTSDEPKWYEHALAYALFTENPICGQSFTGRSTCRPENSQTGRSAEYSIRWKWKNCIHGKHLLQIFLHQKFGELTAKIVHAVHVMSSPRMDRPLVGLSANCRVSHFNNAAYRTATLRCHILQTMLNTITAINANTKSIS